VTPRVGVDVAAIPRIAEAQKRFGDRFLHKFLTDREIDRYEELLAARMRCDPEREAARIAEQATHGPQACGDATFIEVYAKTLPALVTKALKTRTSKHEGAYS